MILEMQGKKLPCGEQRQAGYIYKMLHIIWKQMPFGFGHVNCFPPEASP